MPPPGDEYKAISGRLSEASPLTVLIDERSYHPLPPKNAGRPYLTFYRVGGTDGQRLGGRRGLRQSEFRVEAHADNAEEAAAVILAARDRLHCWRDKPNGVQGCFAQGDTDEFINDDNECVSSETYSLNFAPQ